MSKRCQKEEIVKSLVLSGFTTWQAARAVRTEKVMMVLFRTVLSCPPKLEQEGGLTRGKQSPLSPSQSDRCKNITWAMGSFSRSPVAQPGFNMLARGFGVSGSSRTWLVPVLGGDHMQTKWFSQLVEAGAGGEPLLFLVRNRHLPGMTWAVSRFWNRFFVGCESTKRHDRKQLAY